MNSIYSHWHIDFWTVLMIFILCIFYLMITGFRLYKKSVYFFSAIVLLVLCLASPLHFLAEHYLFSAHMAIHVLILLVAAPLMIAGIPKENKMKKSFISFSEKIKNPAIYWFTGVAIMWFWHIPAVFNAMFSMHQMLLMQLQVFSLLVAGMIFCWPVINPYQKCRLPALQSVLYLSLACIFCSLLGLMITFSAVGTYAPYLHVMDHSQFLPVIRNEWKISVATDQQMAGLIMWVPCCFIYLTASMVLLIKWFDVKSLERLGAEISI